MSKSVTFFEERICRLQNLTINDQSQGSLISSLEDLKKLSVFIVRKNLQPKANSRKKKGSHLKLWIS